MDGPGEEDRTLPAVNVISGGGSDEPPTKMRKKFYGHTWGLRQLAMMKDTKALLQKAVGAEGVVTMTFGFLTDLYRLDAMNYLGMIRVENGKWYFQNTTETFCEYLKTFEDETFCEKAMSKLWELLQQKYHGGLCKLAYRDFNRRMVQKLHEIDVHTLVLQKMRSFPSNAIIQESGGMILYCAMREDYFANGETCSSFGDREQNSLLRFLVSAEAIEQMACTLETHKDNIQLLGNLLQSLKDTVRTIDESATMNEETRRRYAKDEFFENLYRCNIQDICLQSLRDHPDVYLFVWYALDLLMDIMNHDPKRCIGFLSANTDFVDIHLNALHRREERHGDGDIYVHGEAVFVRMPYS